MYLEKEKGIARRDFLKLSGTAASSLVLGRALRKETEYYPNSDVRFRFGDHLLSPDDILTSDSIILGETNLYNIALWHAEELKLRELFSESEALKDVFEDFFIPLVSTPRQDEIEHIEAVIKARRQGMEHVATDTSHSVSLPNEWIRDSISDAYSKGHLRLIGALLAVSTAYLSYSLIRDKKKAQDKYDLEKPQVPYGYREKIKDVALASATVAAAAGVGLTIGHLTSDEGRKLLGNLQPAVDVYLKLVESMGSLGQEEKKEFFRIIDIRNLSMALNTHIVQETLRQNTDLQSSLLKNKDDKKLNILFYAGNGHAKSDNEYKLGLEYLTQRITSEVNMTIDVSREQIVNAQNEKELQNGLETWVGLTSSYSYPIPTYSLRSIFQKSRAFNLPDSPRAILWRELFKKHEKDPENTILRKMIGRLAGEDIVFQHWRTTFGDSEDPFYRSPLLEVEAIRNRAVSSIVP